VSVTNSGPSAALGVTVQEDLPVGGAVTDATATQGGYDAATGIWTVGAGAPAVLTLTVAYDRPGATVSTVTVAGADSTGAGPRWWRRVWRLPAGHRTPGGSHHRGRVRAAAHRARADACCQASADGVTIR
jgi:hypothetical protein